MPSIDTTAVKPWAPQVGETEGEYLFFKAWLLSPWNKSGKPQKRDINVAAAYLRVKKDELDSLSRRRQWASRARAHDSYTIAQEVTGELKDLEEMRKSQNAILNSGMEVLDLSLEALKVGLRSGDKKTIAGLRADIPRLMDMVLKYQNLLYGQATEKVSTTVQFGDDWDLSVLDAEEWQWLKRIRAKVLPRGL